MEPASSRPVPRAAGPHRALLDGSASTGTPAAAPSSATARPVAGGPSPATITVCGPATSSVGGSAGPTGVTVSSVVTGAAANPAGVSGSLSSTFSCTGPGRWLRAPVAAATRRAVSNRQVRGSAVASATAA